MMNRNVIKSFLLGILLTCLCAYTVMAKGVQVQDDYGYLTAQEVTNVSNAIADVESTTGWDIIAVITEDTQGKATDTYGQDFFAANKVSDDGAVMLIDLDNGSFYLVTAGDAISYLTDQKINNAIDAAFPYAADEDYANALIVLVEEIESYYNSAPADGITGFEFFIAVVLALVAGGAFAGTVVGKYRLVWGGYKYSYRENGTVELTHSRDRFVNKVVTTRKIQRDPPRGSGGGGTTISRGSDGNNYGGGGRKL